MSVAFLFLLSNFGSEAFPLIYRRAVTTVPPNFFVLPTRRTLLNIISTCLITILVTEGVAVHPNVQPISRLWVLSRYVDIFWVLVTPELVLAWALRQRFAAADVTRIYNTIRKPDRDKEWTLYHGYFVIMGGFTLIEPNTADPDHVLSFKDFSELVRDPAVKFPPITADEIRDRSKFDELGLLTAVLQVMWFLFQCLIRHNQKLALTQLEIITLMPVIYNAFTVVLWWRKPQYVRVPVKIRLPQSAVHPPAVSQGRFKTTLFSAFFGIIRAETVSAGASHVPRFYAPKTVYGPYGRMFVFAVFGAISGGVLYTGVHSSSFATMSEYKIWHHTSLVATSIPILLLPLDFIIEWRDRKNMPSLPDLPPDLPPELQVQMRLAQLGPPVKISFLDVIFGSLFLLYVAIKIVLIAQAVSLLRTQPPSAFLVADWTIYIPHIS